MHPAGLILATVTSLALALDKGQRFIRMHNESSILSSSEDEQQCGKSPDHPISFNLCDIWGGRSVLKYAVLGKYGNGFEFLSTSL